MGRIYSLESSFKKRGGKFLLERRFKTKAEEKSQNSRYIIIIFSCFYIFLVLYISTALGFSHPKGEFHPPLPFPFPPHSPRHFFISLREISFFLCIGALIVSIISPRFVSFVKFSLKKRAPLSVLLGCSLLIPFFLIPPYYKPFVLGIIFLPAVLGLSGFFSALGDKIASLLKIPDLSEPILVILGMIPFLLFLAFPIDGFYFRLFFNFLMIYGLGGIISTVI